MARKRVEAPSAQVSYVARDVAITALEAIQANLVEIDADARTRRYRIEDMWTRLETETAKGEGLAPRIPLRGLPQWQRQISSFSMDDAWGNFQDELEHYRGQTTKYLALLRDETNWKVSGLEVECDEAENTTQLLNTASELIAGHTHSFDAIVTALWRHGKPVDIPNPFPAIGSVMAPYASSLQSLWRREDSPSLKLVEYADCLASLMRALEHYLAVLREGISGCSEWSTLWADPFAQFRERYNDWLLACERHFSTVLRERAPTFSRLADGVTIRNGAPAGGPLLTSGTFGAGEAFFASDTIRKLIATATTDVLIVDNYSSADTLSFLFSASPASTARVLTSDIKPDYGTMAARYRRERGATSLETRTTNTIHDRYIVVDGTAYYHVGATLKDLGTKLFSFTKKSDAVEIAKIQASLAAAWSSATVVP